MELRDVVLRLAIADDAPALAVLARRTFEDTFARDNRPEDIAQFVTKSFGEAQQRAEIADPEARTLFAELASGLVAFAQLRRQSPPEPSRSEPAVELQRFYVDHAWIGQGLAHRLMQRTLEEAVAMGAGVIWLGVWERNPRAIAFYKKEGFVDVGSHIFQLGADAQTDRVMLRQLRSEVAKGKGGHGT
jgi:diamine N-acetyltransferase